jgi:hypothetical protein
MSQHKSTVEAEVARHFPSAHARKRADEAIDQLDVSMPMSAYLDEWVRAYVAAGGKTEWVAK